MSQSLCKAPGSYSEPSTTFAGLVVLGVTPKNIEKSRTLGSLEYDLARNSFAVEGITINAAFYTAIIRGSGAGPFAMSLEALHVA